MEEKRLNIIYSSTFFIKTLVSVIKYITDFSDQVYLKNSQGKLAFFVKPIMFYDNKQITNTCKKSFMSEKEDTFSM